MIICEFESIAPASVFVVSGGLRRIWHVIIGIAYSRVLGVRRKYVKGLGTAMTK